MKNKVFKKSAFFAGILLLFSISCTKETPDDIPTPPTGTSFEIGFIKTDKGIYDKGEEVWLQDFFIRNTSTTSDTDISSVFVLIKDFESNEILHEFEQETNVKIEKGKEYTFKSIPIFSIPANFKSQSYAISIRITFSSGKKRELYKTFFRVKDSKSLLTYKIEEENYSGLPVFKLRGGLSAEYAVQKSISSLVSGISHSWYTPIATVDSSPDFLELSIKNTISTYNEAIGPTAPIETVIISTGIPGVQYLARNMKAAVLPLHFLVSSNTIKETQTILEQANNSGYSAYGTLGHDFSITNAKAVGWIKLLDLPKEYKDFISQHQVKNVIVLGHTGSDDGETAARKVIDTRNKYQEGVLYLMRFSGDASDGYLKQILDDYDPYLLSPVTKIADWEAGIIDDQINNFSASINNGTTAKTTTITAIDGVHLWNLGTFSSLALIKKNKSTFELGGPAVRGVSLNPYLKGHPSYESWIRYVPFLYFGAFSDEFQYDNWLNTKIRDAIKYYFPNIVFENLTFWVNHRESMASLLESKGLTVRRNDYSIHEMWDLSDGVNSLSEIRAADIVSKTTSTNYKNWNDNLKYLDINDLKNISIQFPEIVIN